MMWLIQLIILIMVVITALAAITVRDLLGAAS